MNKIFIVAGEASGDLVGAWFIRHHLSKFIDSDVYLEGVGGNELSRAGMNLRYPYSSLNVVGFIDLIAKLPAIFRMINKLVSIIVSEQFTHVVLVNFSAFNLRLGKRLKKRNPSLKIIFLAPPQLWCWGAWRLKTLKKSCDELVVLFPFEVDWYIKQGMAVHYLGNPVFDRLRDAINHKQDVSFRLGIFPGSRKQELKRFVPLLSRVVFELLQKFPTLEIAIFIAPYIDQNLLKPLFDVSPQVVSINPNDRIKSMQSCAVALSKAGTVTLELGLLEIPTIIFYKTDWLTFCLAKMLVSIRRMGLPNIISKKDLMPEFIQRDCSIKNIVSAVDVLLKMWQKDRSAYLQQREKNKYLVGLFSQTK